MKQQRKNIPYYLSNLVVSFLLLLAVLSLLIFYPFHDILFPEKISDFTTLDLRVQAPSYVNLTINKLSYTGCDYVHNEKIVGHYYYAFENNCVMFFLLEADQNTSAEETLEDYEANFHLIKSSDLQLDLTTQLANSIGWTYDGLSVLTSPLLASSVNYPGKTAQFLFALFFIQLIILSLYFLHCLFHLIRSLHTQLSKTSSSL